MSDSPVTPQSPGSGSSDRFRFLDPLRGIAATVVVLHHLNVVTVGYFAVLVFFVISGYCITASAEAGVRNGMSFGVYMKRRIRRIYPPYLASIVFFVITRIVKGGNYAQLMRPLHVWIQNITLTQWVSLLDNRGGYPYANGSLFVAAYWSLNYEEQFYIVVGLAMLAGLALGASIRTLLLGLTALTIAVMACFPQLCVGVFFDYWPIFGLGVAVYYRTSPDTSARLRRGLDCALAALLAMCIGMMVSHGHPDPLRRYIWEDLLVGCSLAALLIAVRRIDGRLMGYWPLRAFKKIGTISYSLYLIHQFNINVAMTVAGRIIAPATSRTGNVILELAVLISMAFVFWKLFEQPFLNAPGKHIRQET